MRVPVARRCLNVCSRQCGERRKENAPRQAAGRGCIFQEEEKDTEGDTEFNMRPNAKSSSHAPALLHLQPPHRQRPRAAVVTSLRSLRPFGATFVAFAAA